MAGHLDKSLPLEYQEEQSRLNILGFWIFLGAEIALFSTLFVTYLTYHTRTAGGPTAEELFVVKDFMIETLLLLFSSFTMGIAIFKMRNNDLKGLLVWFVITLVLGGGFLFYEIREFYMYAVHEGATMQTSAFLSGFFTLLGTHGLHVTVGVFWAISIIIQLVRRGLTPVTARKVFIIGLYWHFLDVVWIFIFTLVYLNGLVG
ncbi:MULTISPECIES: cytochrome aa3 quinol oxidase subunit III [Priestia]|jgi:cytochrome aa3-600 menaquinol oxidase subunit 3|uniref:Quinol oxidase subunit 3 n=10 Tax=Priestia TaxID=2800373 RepID=D5DX86_PRIM1|nr:MULTISPECIES: cytochrome aa3 quinol oxidase subunit III [Priestia]AVX09120.1 cytochrome aa3 quinol oxidase subunit III [Bacillus sp. Y-01]KOP75253.1 cytochrome o ubiquinol oxidase subunit III [Bacillus sp. FJAT-21351]KQU16810.1 cytochrome o ubiquinol oxidase subunit III [Bacillus sp. Leaf75]KRD90598.1 cytochrome o ubiquinol oxidase subunit III [Bacillus sp. Root147]KRD99515.1 cytochrome o ubiquinol oxidase subunit III [Bacillus sp. Root239]KRF56555.1 cytochrome o ubiquinol oxidase subunit 